MDATSNSQYGGSSVNPVVNDYLTRVQLRLLKQEIDKENAKSKFEFDQDDTFFDKEKERKLKEEIKRKETLLKRIKDEQELLQSHRFNRPRSEVLETTRTERQQTHRRADSLPPVQDLRLYQYPQFQPYQQQPPSETVNQMNFIPSLPMVSSRHSSLPYIIQPYVVNPPTQPSGQQINNNNRTDMYEMMMMQNAQMHQLIMHQLMFSHLPNIDNNNQRRSNNNNRDRDLEEIRKLLDTPVEDQRARIHHHYNIPQYSVLPSISSNYPYHVEPLQVPQLTGQPNKSRRETAHLDDSTKTMH